MMLKSLPRTALFIAVCTALAGTAFAEVTPKRGKYDNRVREARYVDGQVYKLRTTLTHVTSVEFGDGEAIVSIISGDTEGFQFDAVPGGKAFAIKPVLSAAHTNITVYTNRRAYYFNVIESSKATDYVVRFGYPKSAKKKANKAVKTVAKNFDYGVSKNLKWGPTSVWDDGVFTYFRYSDNTTLPAIFRWEDNKEATVNSSVMEDGVIRVGGVNGRWVLRNGDVELCIQELSTNGGVTND